MASGTTPQGRVPRETVQKAISALLKWRHSNSHSQKPNLFGHDDDDFLYLVLTLNKIPQKNAHVSPHKVPLPYTLLSPFSETCLIIDDRPKSSLTKADAEKKIKALNVAVSKVLKLSKLASDYRAFEAKRKLRDSYDLFFADRRVLPLLPRLLGRKFFDKKKVPVPLDLKKADWKEQVEGACSSALFFVGTGTCSVVKVAKLSMAREEIVANVVVAIEGIADAVPKKWGNVRSFHVKLLESLALPVYQAVPDVRLRIEGGKGEVVEKAKEKEEEGEEKGKKKKGRIHEVRYMDSEIGEDLHDEVVPKEDSDNDEKGSGELESKKRKKGVRMEKVALSSVTRMKQSELVKPEGADMKKKVKAKRSKIAA